MTYCGTACIKPTTHNRIFAKNVYRFPIHKEIIWLNVIGKIKIVIHYDKMFGQPFDIGSKVAYMLPIELANTCKGYGYGEITKITPKTVTLKVGDKLLRKNRNKIIVSN